MRLRGELFYNIRQARVGLINDNLIFRAMRASFGIMHFDFNGRLDHRAVSPLQLAYEGIEMTKF